MIYIRDSKLIADDIVICTTSTTGKNLYHMSIYVLPKIRHTVITELYKYIDSLDPIIKQKIKITISIERNNKIT